MDTNPRSEFPEQVAQKVEGASATAQEAIAQAAETLAQKEARIQAGIAAASEAAQNFIGTAGEHVSELARTTDEAIRKNPYQALGIAIAAGLLCGYFLKRK